MKVAWCPLIFTEGWPIRAQSIGCPIHRKSVHGSIKKLNRHWFFREGGQNETSTNEIVSIMTNYIQENSFELGFDGMEIKFTSLQEKKSFKMSILCYINSTHTSYSFINGRYVVLDTLYWLINWLIKDKSFKTAILQVLDTNYLLLFLCLILHYTIVSRTLHIYLYQLQL